MKLGELAQGARSHRPMKKTSSIDLNLLRASGDAARRRRGSTASEVSTCELLSRRPSPSARSTPCVSPLLCPANPYKSPYDFMVPVQPSWKGNASTANGGFGAERFVGNGRDRDSFMGLDVNVGPPFEIHSPFEIGMALELRIVNMDGL